MAKGAAGSPGPGGQRRSVFDDYHAQAGTTVAQGGVAMARDVELEENLEVLEASGPSMSARVALRGRGRKGSVPHVEVSPLAAEGLLDLATGEEAAGPLSQPRPGGRRRKSVFEKPPPRRDSRASPGLSAGEPAAASPAAVAAGSPRAEEAPRAGFSRMSVHGQDGGAGSGGQGEGGAEAEGAGARRKKESRRSDFGFDTVRQASFRPYDDDEDYNPMAKVRQSEILSLVKSVESRKKMILEGGAEDYDYDDWPRFVMHPIANTFRRSWDAFMTVLIVFTAIVVPFQVAFYFQTRVDPRSADYVVDSIFNAFFILDIVLNFFTGHIRDGSLYMRHRDIAKYYAKGPLLLDLISSFPYEALGGDGNDANETKELGLFRMLKTVRLFRLLRLLRLSRIVTRFQTIFNIKFVYLTVVKFIISVLFISHWMACAWFLLAQLQGLEASWAAHEQTDGIIGKTPWQQYLLSIYHATMIMSTIGSHIVPVTDAEFGCSILFMFIGASTFAYGLTNLSDMIFNLNRPEVKFREQMDDLNDFFESREIPQDMRVKIREYYDYLHSRNRFYAEETIISSLSDTLKRDVLIFINRPILKNEFFKDFDSTFNAAIISVLLRQTFQPKEVVLREGDPGRAMFFLLEGELDIFVGGTVVKSLYPGSFVGEVR